ncbi:hypothetical protein QE152_g7645 [Popillia japonica]|uniref:Uncharacterized protein n=1 Tax=Popillia japonica TaxID=7064 RepID=A0AAW1M9H1_POPJA
MSSETFTKNSDKCNLSSATYKIDRKSPELILEERLSNISSDTYIKANISASTYTKEGIPVEFNFSGSAPSPIATEAYHEEVLYRSEYIYQTEVVHNRQCLEQILEESHVSSDVSEINRTSRKRRSEYNLKVASPKRKSQNFGNSNHSFQDMGHKVVPVCKRSFKPIKSLNLKEMMEKSRDNLTTVEENIVQNQTVKTKYESEVFPTHNPFILTAVDSIDPFMCSSMYYDARWVDEQQNSFKKWLNALLTPPEELDSNAEGTRLDVAKLWQDCKKREVSKAPTKEHVREVQQVSHEESIRFPEKKCGNILQIAFN